MLNLDDLEKASTKYQMPLIAVAREYSQHAVLASLYSQKETQMLLFKGGTALRIIFNSPRFSEDLDFTAVKALSYGEIENMLTEVLSALNAWGFRIELKEAKQTTGGYLAKIDFSLYNTVFEIKLEISFRKHRQKIIHEVASVKNDYIHTYTLIHMSLSDIMTEKITALLTRAKARDWYDFYFFLRNGMLEAKHKKHFEEILDKLKKSRTDFKKELKDFFPKSHQIILKDFKLILEREIKKFV